MMLGVDQQPYHPSHASDAVWTPFFDRLLVIVIPSHNLASLYFPHPGRLNMWYASRELLDTIVVFEATEKHSAVFFLHHCVLVRHHTRYVDSTMDISVLFNWYNRVVGIIL
jgi:hypothetical protein